MAASRPGFASAPPPAARAARASRRGGVPAWIPVGVLVAGAAWLCSDLSASVDAAGFALVDLRRSRLDAPPGFRDPRWQDYLALHLAQLRPVDSRDREQEIGRAHV